MKRIEQIVGNFHSCSIRQFQVTGFFGHWLVVVVTTEE
jgi:hypothetical protein